MDLIVEKFHAEHAMAFMAERPLLARCALVGVFGVLVHHLVFIKNEWHMQGPRIIKTVSAAYAVLALLEARKTLSVAAFGHAGLIVGSFILSLLFSIGAYRLFFHRTRHFPGPRLAGLTKLWHMYQCRNGQNHLVLERMHREYGDFVRTGPNEITVFHPNGLALLDGPGSKTSKSVWYDFLLPNVGVTTIRERGWHDQRRRLWIKGFSNSAMQKYQEHIEAHVQDMDAIIAAAKGSPVPISTYIYWFAFDIMGLFAFSRSFDMLRSEHWHYSIRNLRKAMTLLGPFSSVPWAAQIGFWLLKGYWVVNDWHTMIAWCANQMQLRLDEPDSHDVAQGIIADSKKRGTLKEDQEQLVGDAIVAIVAGSDTVAPTLVFAIYQLALNPDKAEKLYQEVKDVSIKDLATFKKLPYLNAVIMETLRLHPAVPTGGNRDTPPEGMMIDGTFIPGNTTIVAPRYVLGRLESCFVRPNEWIPERFDTQPELVKDTRSFLPFAQGRYTCLGKDVAMIEMWTVLTVLITKYRFDFPAGQREKYIQNVEGKMRDQFTATPGDLALVFSKRENITSN